MEISRYGPEPPAITPPVVSTSVVAAVDTPSYPTPDYGGSDAAPPSYNEFQNMAGRETLV
jgi:hypothetical protein